MVSKTTKAITTLCQLIIIKTSRLVFTARLRPQFRMPPELRSLHAAAPPVQSEYPAQRRAAAAGANFKIYLRQYCSNGVDFLQYTGDTDTKNDGPEF